MNKGNLNQDVPEVLSGGPVGVQALDGFGLAVLDNFFADRPTTSAASSRRQPLRIGAAITSRFAPAIPPGE